MILIVMDQGSDYILDRVVCVRVRGGRRFRGPFLTSSQTRQTPQVQAKTKVRKRPPIQPPALLLRGSLGGSLVKKLCLGYHQRGNATAAPWHRGLTWEKARLGMGLDVLMPKRRAY
ncbi:UNVERIFIED_CONTAM: hypothetical protein K2H54_041452 [Gekko kuhli]